MSSNKDKTNLKKPTPDRNNSNKFNRNESAISNDTISVNVNDLRSIIKTEIQTFCNKLSNELADRIELFEKNIQDSLHILKKLMKMTLKYWQNILKN